MVGKGFVKTMEASLSIILILATVVFLFSGDKNYASQVPDKPSICLQYIENRGLLSYYAFNDMKVELEDDLRSCMPPSFNYTVSICQSSSCSSDSLPLGKEVFVSSYLVAGDKEMKPSLINLWFWSK